MSQSLMALTNRWCYAYAIFLVVKLWERCLIPPLLSAFLWFSPGISCLLPATQYTASWGASVVNPSLHFHENPCFCRLYCDGYQGIKVNAAWASDDLSLGYSWYSYICTVLSSPEFMVMGKPFLALFLLVRLVLKSARVCCDEQTRDCFDRDFRVTSLDKLWQILWPMKAQCCGPLTNQRSALCSHPLAIVTRLISDPSHKIIQASGVNRIPLPVSSTVWFPWDCRNVMQLVFKLLYKELLWQLRWKNGNFNQYLSFKTLSLLFTARRV